MSTPLLKTKTSTPPVRPELVSRPHLVERLNAGLHCELTLISAPAGFGKTTLLSEWVVACGQSVAWVSLDEGDSDPARFWAYVIAALQTVQPDIGEAALAALQSSQPPSVETLLTGLINEIAESPDPLVLVLDDLHAINHTQIHYGLVFLLDNLPRSLHLVIASRADPPWPLARLRGRGEIIELRIHDLRFTPEEVAAFLNDVMQLDLPPEDRVALEARTEGWIAGLQMAAVSMQGRKLARGAGDTSGFIKAFTGSHRFILDYLVEEVLDQQSAEVKDFLLKTSILERMTASACDAVTNRDDSEATLSHLEQSNLFLVPLDEERRWYRYHRLFADLLRSRLQQNTPELVPDLHRTASEWFQRQGLVHEAVDHALQAGDMEQAARLVESHAAQVITRSELATLSRWLEALPRELVHTRPWLCVYQASTKHWGGQREEVESCLQRAEQLLEGMAWPSEDEEGVTATLVSTESEKKLIAGYIASIRAHDALVNGDIPRVVEMSHRALAHLPEGDCARSGVGIALGGAYWGQGNVAAAEEAFAEGHTSAMRCGQPLLAVSPACYVGMQQVKQGRLYEAADTYRKALDLAKGSSGRRLPVAGFPMIKLGDLSREWNDLENASHYLSEGVELCERLGQSDVLADAYVALARLQLVRGDLAGARESLQEAGRLAQSTTIDPFVVCWLDDCRLRYWLAAGNVAAAVHWVGESGLRVDGEFSYHHDLHHINLARVLVAQGAQQPAAHYLHEAVGLLARLLEAAEKAGWIHEAIKVLVLQALAHQAADNNELALTALSRALTLAEPGGHVRIFVDEGTPLNQLLQEVVARGIRLDYATRLLAALDGEGTDGRLAQERRPSSLLEPLSERELEVLRLLTTSLSTPEIADQLFISVNTVRSHVKNIYGKLDVHNRLEAVARAEELNLL